MIPRLLSTAAAVTIAAATVTAAAASAGATPTAAAHTATVSALPPFTVLNQGGALAIYRTGTHNLTGVIAVPTGLEFDQVASGGTASTFLVSIGTPAFAACHAAFYKFSLSSAGKPSALTLLHSASGSLPTAIGASPGGGTITYSAVRCSSSVGGVIGTMGKAGNHSWTYDLHEDYPTSLAATSSGGTLTFPGFVNNVDHVLLLNTASKSTTVIGASRVVPGLLNSSSIAISPDGKTLYAMTGSAALVQLAAYDAATGKFLRVLHKWASSASQPEVSADATGRYLLAATMLGSSPSLIGFDLRTGASVTLPGLSMSPIEGNQIAW